MPGARITVSGPIDHDAAALLSRHLHGVFAGAATAVMVDLSGVPRCNATGVRVLVAARDHARSTGTELHLMHLNNTGSDFLPPRPRAARPKNAYG